MKKLSLSLLKAFSIAMLTLAFVSCGSDEPSVKPIDVTVKLVLPNPSPVETSHEARSVVLTSASGVVQTLKTSADGSVTFREVVPGNYSISTAWDEGGYTFGSALASQLFSASQTIKLTVTPSIKQSLLISKVYYSGSKDKVKKDYAGGLYIELFNNGDAPVELSEYMLGIVESENIVGKNIENIKTTTYFKQIFGFTPRQVAPGTSILIVNSAIDHTASVSEEANLSSADYEAKDGSGKTANNSTTPALTLHYTSFPAITKMNLIKNGVNSVVLFKTTEDPKAFPLSNKDGDANGKGTKYASLSVKYIVDGVELLAYNKNGVNVATKRLADVVDAGYLAGEDTGSTHRVAVRKTDNAKSTASRTYLVDTNNSKNDFHFIVGAKPRIYNY